MLPTILIVSPLILVALPMILVVPPMILILLPMILILLPIILILSLSKDEEKQAMSAEPILRQAQDEDFRAAPALIRPIQYRPHPEPVEA